MGRRSLLFAVVFAALVWSGSALAATPQQLTIAASDGAKLACSVVVPDTPAPAGGYPGVMLFHGLGGKHEDMEPLATQFLAPAGYESLECDARGHGAVGGPLRARRPARRAGHARALHLALGAHRATRRSARSASRSAAAPSGTRRSAGVPFKAIVPVITWTNLATALAPQGLSKSGLVNYLAALVPESRWDPELLAAKPALVSSTNMAAVDALAASRSPLAKLSSLTTPTLLIQGRRDFLFDIDQALAAYKALKGPKRLYVGDLGHSPGISPATAPDAAIVLGRSGQVVRPVPEAAPANGIDQPVVELGHDPFDGKTTTFKTACRRRRRRSR